ncbi:UDP-glucose 4-epimerase GalE [Acinetobacter puyangensis]|uniref:UDP-glucose 4-epimerase n=1 Tax=Acinetobacter puyangensis TaxID=1096779 RepID=A0A240EAL6_9GAMM|nr:NAD-dependent epimerase/dehydratase family protein [Acinetobacter puyangensis]SNX45596.1 UDP-glucose 4-epimerase [Acinetobacter puyangensis]
MILVTGGLGYLGSHIALYLMSKGHEVVLVDNLSQSSMETLERLEYITKLYIPFIRLDVRNTPVLQKVFDQYPIEYVIHTAGFKNLSESTLRPLEYYNNNLGCVMSVLRTLQRTGVKRLVNLSSLAVYGESGTAWQEDSAFNVEHHNPYIRAQQNIEHILRDTYTADSFWQIINLRLSNVIGAYTDAQLGEWTPLLPKSVLPNLLQVAAQQKDIFDLFHEDLDTQDGSSERSYIHIMDVLDAVYKLMLWSNTQKNFLNSYNVASDQLTSLKQLIEKVEEVTQSSITTAPYEASSTEIASLGADTQKLKQEIDWSANFSVEDAIRDQWKYYQMVLAK